MPSFAALLLALTGWFSGFSPDAIEARSCVPASQDDTATCTEAPPPAPSPFKHTPDPKSSGLYVGF